MKLENEFRLLIKLNDWIGGIPGFFQRLRSKRTGLALMVATPLVVFAWHLLALTGRPAHLNKITAEPGSTIAGIFVHDPVPDPTGERVLFIESTETGFGIYFQNIGDRRKLMFEDTYQKGDTHPWDELLGWSPDDKFLAYYRRNIPLGHRELVICDGDTGDARATLNIRQPVVTGAWLSPDTLAYADDQRVLYTVRRAWGKWSAQPFNYFENRSHRLPGEPIQNLTPFDAHSVVWQQGKTIWKCGENSVPEKVWDSGPNALLEFSYSPAAKRFLFHCQDAQGPYFVSYYPGQNNQLENVMRVDTDKYNPKNLTLINDGKGYAFLSQSADASDVMVIKPDNSRDPVEFQWQGRTRGFTVGEDAIFVAASLHYQPTGIWKYDIASGSATCVVPCREKDFYYETNCPVEADTITNSAGETLTYYLYTPSRLSAKKKHPLVMCIHGLGPKGFKWNAYEDAFANCGIYFAYVERYHRDFSLADDALSAYESLAKRPDIDTHNVYLLGISAGAPPVNELLQKRPELWRGAILWSPVGLPNPSQIPGTRIFLDCGSSDPDSGRGGQRAIQFQDEAAKAGIPVTFLLHPGLRHMLGVPVVEKERERETLIFLNEP